MRLLGTIAAFGGAILAAASYLAFWALVYGALFVVLTKLAFGWFGGF